MFNKFGAVNSIRDGKYREVGGKNRDFKNKKKRYQIKLLKVAR